MNNTKKNKTALRVVLVHPSINTRTGGIVKAGLSYIEGLIKLGHEVIVWTPSTIFSKGAEQLGAKVNFDPRLTSVLSILTKPSLLFRLRRDFRSSDAIIHNNGRLWPIGYIDRKSNHFVVFHNRSIGSRGYFPNWLPISDAQFRILNEASKTKHWLKSIHRIKNGIATHAWDPLPQMGRTNATPIIGFLAEIRPQKGLDVLIDAAAILKSRGVKFLLRIGGDGNDVELYRNRTIRLDLQTNIEWAGWINSPNDFFDNLNVFCLPSRREGFPLVLLEAMARKIPVVATRIDGSTELVEASNGGILFDIDDSEALADTLQNLLGDRGLQTKLGSDGFAYVHNNFKPVHIGQMIEAAIIEEKNNKTMWRDRTDICASSLKLPSE